MSSDSLPDPSSESLVGFADNWAYLKTELNWLERVLMLSVARHRQERRTVNRVAQNRADRVSSHWWKGVVSLDRAPAYDEHRKVSRSTSDSAQRGGYQQQLETRIRDSRAQGIMLALPSLRDRLQLSLFEKNMVLMGLAPEVNRRFAKMYRYLQGQPEDDISDLPTVELVLRLLSRNDSEWRQARYQITHDSFLIQHGLISLIQQPYDTLLTTSIKVSEPLLSFLMAEQPSSEDLETLLDKTTSRHWDHFPENGHSNERSPALTQPEFFTSRPFANPEIIPLKTPPHSQTLHNFPESRTTSTHSQPDALSQVTSLIQVDPHPQESWSDLIVPEAIAHDLKHWASRVHLLQQDGEAFVPCLGTMALLTGASGTGKKTAARAIAHQLTSDLHWVDLRDVSHDQIESLICQVENLKPLVLLVQGAGQWLSRSSSLSNSALLHQWAAQRRQSLGLTIWSDTERERIATHWTHEMDFVLTLPVPNKRDRQKLWERAIAKLPESVQSKRGINTAILSAMELTGGNIEKVVRDGAIAAAARRGKLNLDDIQNALNRSRYDRALRQLAQARSKK